MELLLLFLVFNCLLTSGDFPSRHMVEKEKANGGGPLVRMAYGLLTQWKIKIFATLECSYVVSSHAYVLFRQGLLVQEKRLNGRSPYLGRKRVKPDFHFLKPITV
ncbi:hypothetical protein V6N13_114957 [Hibiscus sabdariffa]|uniref:Secreted protein n=1 Tax=Hibiscus sabdariffa TaxID=183260 RepID=A0ABR2U3D7_9ROSI